MAQPDVAAGQLQRLVSDAQLPNVTMLVLPFSAGLHGSMSGSFMLLDFGLEVSLDVGYQEYAAGATWWTIRMLCDYSAICITRSAAGLSMPTRA